MNGPYIPDPPDWFLAHVELYLGISGAVLVVALVLLAGVILWSRRAAANSHGPAGTKESRPEMTAYPPTEGTR